MTKETRLADDVPLLVRRLDEARFKLLEASARHGIPTDPEVDAIGLVIQRLVVERERALRDDAKAARAAVFA